MKRILLASAVVAAPLVQGCSPRAAATKVVANALSSGPAGAVYAEDDDPELVRAAVPFGLKMMEALLVEHPAHEGLLTALASGFTQFSYGFVQGDADREELAGHAAPAQAARARAKDLYLRARDYGLRGLEVRHKGITAALHGVRVLGPSLAELTKDDLPLVYWTAASWALAISAAKEDMALVAELPVPGALMTRALSLDESWNDGAIHEFFVSWDAAKGTDAGYALAQEHFDRAVTLSRGRKLGVFVAYAESVAVPRQDHAEFNRLLRWVISADAESDKEHRLANILAQRKAKLLLAHAEDLFA